MKKLFIDEIEAGDQVIDFFLVRSKNLLSTRTGKPYLDLELQDKKGFVTAKMWDGVDKVEDLFERGDIVKIKASAQEYRGQLQIKIDDIRLPAPQENMDLQDFLPSTSGDVEAMHREIIELIESIDNEYLIELLTAFWEEEDFRSNFVRSPGARGIHHAYLGGLLEHTLNVTRLADKCAGIYPELDRDLLVAMAILHDVGKMVELDAGAEIVFTREGMLMGHISIGLEMISEKIKTIIGFPEELALKCKHILLSHHGELEFGSPVVPKIPEAMVLHYIDNLDAKAKIFFQAIEDDRNTAEEFTSYHRVMGRNIYKGAIENKKDDTAEDPK